MLIQQALSNFGLALKKPNWLAKYYDAKEIGYLIWEIRYPLKMLRQKLC